MSYRFVGRLAEGGFSQVFEVEDPASALPERLVLKRLTAEMSARPEVREAFAEEGKILRELKHPNVVTFRRCYFDEKQRVCLLMEKVTGKPLDAWARDHAASADAVLDLFESVLRAVDYLHHRGTPFLHLDLKPDNVLVGSTPEGCQPVLIDFGIARRSGRSGLKAFTPPYGAPEQQAGGALDCSTDVYALGQMLAELLDVLQPAARADQAIRGVAAKAIRPRRRERYADAGEMRLAFSQARRGTSSPGGRFALPGLPARVPTWMAVAAAALVVAAVAVLFALLTQHPAAPSGRSPEARAAFVGAAADEKVRFAELEYRFEEALIQERREAAEYYRQARDLSDSVPAGSDNWRWMKGELDTMSNHMSMAAEGGPAAEWVRSEIQTKHLNQRNGASTLPAAAAEPR